MLTSAPAASATYDVAQGTGLPPLASTALMSTQVNPTESSAMVAPCLPTGIHTFVPTTRPVAYALLYGIPVATGNPGQVAPVAMTWQSSRVKLWKALKTLVRAGSKNAW